MNSTLLDKRIREELNSFTYFNYGFFWKYINNDTDYLEIISWIKENSNLSKYDKTPISLERIENNVNSTVVKYGFELYERKIYIEKFNEYNLNFISKLKTWISDFEKTIIDDDNYKLSREAIRYLRQLQRNNSYFTDEIKRIDDEVFNYYSKRNKSTKIESADHANIEQTEEVETVYLWENKTDLVILIQALWKNNSIKKNGKPIQRNELINLFSKIFNTNITTFDTLLKQGINPKTKHNFIELLLQQIEECKDEIARKKRSKED